MLYATMTHDTMFGTSEPLYAFCLNPMSDFAICNQMLVAHLSHAMSPFELKSASQKFDSGAPMM
jgi:hypothetical protein